MNRLLLSLCLLTFACDTSTKDDAGGDEATEDGDGSGGEGTTEGTSTELDSDGDGLSDAEEADLGTDPDLVDSDGDGIEDGDEVDQGLNPLDTDSDGDGIDDGEELDIGTDPSDATSKPYTGGWPMDSCADEISGAPSSNRNGEVVNNFQLTDQHGDLVNFYDFCDHAVLLVVSAEWCGPCVSYKSTQDQFWNEFHEDGLMILDLLGEDSRGAAPDQATLQRWADGHEFAVVADPNWTEADGGNFVSGGIPAISLIDRGMVAVELDGYPGMRDIADLLR